MPQASAGPLWPTVNGGSFLSKQWNQSINPFLVLALQIHWINGQECYKEGWRRALFQFDVGEFRFDEHHLIKPYNLNNVDIFCQIYPPKPTKDCHLI
jgi:hypothetical protein